ncbi:PQQ-dependent sugar dehydrogenase [Pigmentiphaga aceris]|uniref:PQQ-dependent sugar dehydrogenase n=1 Tax=Pigmentiphaga aceris TaxID=1940612 RepID=A0A5C0AS47_9BURK|nr:PQQ-dependent sugar dehydrogenase [Pigmentiphaga aceris]QEI05022.1 PQQ-dependent sugar dehydrogenase [Pigmentiphaga aceris]
MPVSTQLPQARLLRSALAAVLAVSFSAASGLAYAQAKRPGSEISPTKAALPAGVQSVVWAKGLVNPWAVALLPDGRALVTEKPGRMRVIAVDGSLSAPIQGLPPIAAGGQGGLLDVVLDPDYENNRRIFFSYSEPGQNRGENSTAVASAELTSEGSNWALKDVKVIFSQEPKVSSTAHFGSRLVFGRDGSLFITLGDRFSRRDDAQLLNQHHGKIVRVRADGGVPSDNPFARQKDAKPEIWSLGHRNVQGAAIQPQTGELWINEHGPQGGDEINVIERGANYGWPKFTYGENYGGGKIGEESSAPGFTPPEYSWVPSVGTSGMAFYTSDRIPSWKGSLFVGGLREQALIRLTVRERKVVAEERLLSGEGMRIRDVRAGADGALYVVTDAADGKVLRISAR